MKCPTSARSCRIIFRSSKPHPPPLLLHQQGIAHRYRAPKPLPLARPPFKFSDVQKAIPRHCFKRDLATSAYHLASDLILVATFGFLATFISHGAVPAWAGFLLWPLYWFVQGTQMTGVWVIAHECGHQAFSESKTINNLVGLVCHSALLVPYHSWRITHAKHHSNTGSCVHDEVFCPATRSDSGRSPTAEEDIAEVVHEAPFVQMFWIVTMLLFGWMPGYLFFNVAGPSKYRGFAKSHFNPWAKVSGTKARLVLLSYLCGTAVVRVVSWYVTSYIRTRVRTGAWVVWETYKYRIISYVGTAVFDSTLDRAQSLVASWCCYEYYDSIGIDT